VEYVTMSAKPTLTKMESLKTHPTSHARTYRRISGTCPKIYKATCHEEKTKTSKCRKCSVVKTTGRATNRPRSKLYLRSFIHSFSLSRRRKVSANLCPRKALQKSSSSWCVLIFTSEVGYATQVRTKPLPIWSSSRKDPSDWSTVPDSTMPAQLEHAPARHE
jgi:hypothetical protein